MGWVLAVSVSLFCVFGVYGWTRLIDSVFAKPVETNNTTCNTFQKGYQCFSNVSHHWGQYAPYFAVDNQPGYSSEVPANCQITFAQVLSRHGARYPTASKGTIYSDLVAGIKQNASSLTGKYEFLRTYEYDMGTDDLTRFGERQLVDSGMKFYHRYENLTRNTVPFMRASGSSRVVASGKKFSQGFQRAKDHDKRANHDQAAPDISVIIPEGEQFNNTLEHSVCTKFENSKLGDTVQDRFTNTFIPSIRERLSSDLQNVTLTNSDVAYLMDICAFDTVARTPDASELSPFCALFTEHEFAHYNYLLSVKKYYGHGGGNPLGPAQGIGYTNELIARLTQTPVHDHTSTNHTLDSSRTTFPLNSTLYADFGHDNGMVSIFFALGLYNGTQPLPQHSAESARQADGYSAAWAVPFAARAYVEMMQCPTEREPLVRVLVNDRVMPLHRCKADAMGRCRRDEFVRGLSFARSGGNWETCFS